MKLRRWIACGVRGSAAPLALIGVIVLWGCSSPQTRNNDTSGASASGESSGSVNTDWSGVYDPGGSPTPTSGWHNDGKDCMTCHQSGGSGPEFVFGGTVYKADGTTPAPHVQLGVKAGETWLSAYSGDNGNYWVVSKTAVDWSTAEIRFRNGKGDKKMMTAATAACNQCHTGGQVLLEP